MLRKKKKKRLYIIGGNIIADDKYMRDKLLDTPQAPVPLQPVVSIRLQEHPKCVLYFCPFFAVCRSRSGTVLSKRMSGVLNACLGFHSHDHIF
jgi:hypothetical protein